MSETNLHVETPPEAITGPAWIDRSIAWIKTRERWLLGLGVALHFIVLSTMIALRVAPHLAGETIFLRVEPVDPRDLFRGDYVTLSYAINRVPPEGIEGISGSKNRNWWRRPDRTDPNAAGRTIYAWLEKEENGRTWRPTKISIDPPINGKYIRGTYYPNQWPNLRYGIEAFYVQQGKGREYEDAARKRRLIAEVNVAADGQAGLRGLRIE